MNHAVRVELDDTRAYQLGTPLRMPTLLGQETALHVELVRLAAEEYVRRVLAEARDGTWQNSARACAVADGRLLFQLRSWDTRVRPLEQVMLTRAFLVEYPIDVYAAVPHVVGPKGLWPLFGEDLED